MMNYYYQLLNTHEKLIYDRIVLSLERHSGRVFLPDLCVSGQRLREISLFVTLDYPDYYWTKGSFELRREGQGAVLFFPPLISREEAAGAEEAMTAGITSLVEGIPADPVQATEVLCRRLLEFTEYDLDPDPMEERRDQSIWSVFIRRKSICMGLAKALCLMLRLAGVDSIIVLGHVFGDHAHGHSWNLVRIGEEWKHVDVTMGYPCFRSLWEAYHPGAPVPAGPVSFEALRSSHELRREFPYPGSGMDLF